SRLAAVVERPRVEAQIGAPVLVPIGAEVPARPDVVGDVRTTFLQCFVEGDVGDQEGVFIPGVVPDRDRAEGAGVFADARDHVVAFEVFGVVEGAGGAGAAF